MGTNYYLKTPGCSNACDHCSASVLRHIGKSSAGWKFLFQAEPDWPRDSAYKLWHTMVADTLQAGGHIEDEYGVHTTFKELTELIEAKQQLRSHSDPDPDARARWRARGEERLYDSLKQSDFDCDGYDFCDREFS
jgi:hypothetical protein